jgi:hypothetical protein
MPMRNLDYYQPLGNEYFMLPTAIVKVTDNIFSVCLKSTPLRTLQNRRGTVSNKVQQDSFCTLFKNLLDFVEQIDQGEVYGDGTESGIHKGEFSGPKPCSST